METSKPAAVERTQREIQVEALSIMETLILVVCVSGYLTFMICGFVYVGMGEKAKPTFLAPMFHALTVIFSIGTGLCIRGMKFSALSEDEEKKKNKLLRLLALMMTLTFLVLGYYLNCYVALLTFLLIWFLSGL